MAMAVSDVRYSREPHVALKNRSSQKYRRVGKKRERVEKASSRFQQRIALSGSMIDQTDRALFHRRSALHQRGEGQRRA